MEKPPDGIQKEKPRRSWRQPRFINQVGPGAGGPNAMEPDSLLDQDDSYGKSGAGKVAEWGFSRCSGGLFSAYGRNLS